MMTECYRCTGDAFSGFLPCDDYPACTRVHVTPDGQECPEHPQAAGDGAAVQHRFPRGGQAVAGLSCGCVLYGGVWTRCAAHEEPAMMRNPLYREYVGPAYGAISAALNCLEVAVRRDSDDDSLIDAVCALREASAAVSRWTAACDEKDDQ